MLQDRVNAMPRDPKPPLPLRLGTARRKDGRMVLVAPLPGDSDRVVDLNRAETARLQRLGEGAPELLAKALVPPSLQALLESGPRAVQRARVALAYAEKWHRRGDLPSVVAPARAEVTLCPCLPAPKGVRRADGTGALPLVRSAEMLLAQRPQPTLAAVGGFEGILGHCLAVEDPFGVTLGAWLETELDFSDRLEMQFGEHRQAMPMEIWADLDAPNLAPGELWLLPAPRFRPLPGLKEGVVVTLRTAFEELTLTLEEGGLHPTVQ